MKKPLFTFAIFLLVICNSYSFEYKYCRADTTYEVFILRLKIQFFIEKQGKIYPYTNSTWKEKTIQMNGMRLKA